MSLHQITAPCTIVSEDGTVTFYLRPGPFVELSDEQAAEHAACVRRAGEDAPDGEQAPTPDGEDAVDPLADPPADPAASGEQAPEAGPSSQDAPTPTSDGEPTIDAETPRSRRNRGRSDGD